MAKKIRRLPPLTPDVVERFWKKVQKRGENDCWLVRGTVRGEECWELRGPTIWPRVSPA
jgi:hypothetical protein